MRITWEWYEFSHFFFITEAQLHRWDYCLISPVHECTKVIWLSLIITDEEFIRSHYCLSPACNTSIWARWDRYGNVTNWAQNLADRRKNYSTAERVKHRIHLQEELRSSPRGLLQSLDQNKSSFASISIGHATSFFKFAYQVPTAFTVYGSAYPMVSVLDTQCLWGIFSVKLINLYNFHTFFSCIQHVVQKAKNVAHISQYLVAMFYVESGNLHTLVSFSFIEGNSIG